MIETIHVKEPLVDLHSRKSSLFHSFAFDLTVPVTVELLVELVEVVKLLGGLFLAIDSTVDHSGCQALLYALSLLFAEAFAGDLRSCIL